MQDWHDGQAWHDLAELTGPGNSAVVAGVGVRVPDDWKIVQRGEWLSNIAHHLAVNESADVVPLGPADVPEMLDLLARTQPGPFTRRAVEHGAVLGIRRSGVLVSMGGERIRTPGWAEIGTVCTDPDP